MKTQVLSIQHISEDDSLQVWMSIGDKQQKFTFSRDFDQIGKHQLQIITYGSDFGETFKFNQHIVGEVINLVKQCYQGNHIRLPQEVGDFGTPEAALALQKPFKKKGVA
jgi:hypothetical protein